MSLLVHVVKHSNVDIKNFHGPYGLVDPALRKQAFWKRNNIVEVHIVAPTAAKVCFDAAQVTEFLNGTVLNKGLADRPEKFQHTSFKKRP